MKKESIRFNSYTREWAWLSNFSPHAVGDFPTAEHAYQAAKSIRPEDWEYMRSLPTPKAVKAYSYLIHPENRRPNWDKIKLKVMARAIHRKFQNSDLRDKLMDTDGRTLIHLSPWDTYWGVDGFGEGENHLGKIIMAERERLWNEQIADWNW
jgi:ribA/ribD-fused uncharacterized protein